MNSNEIATVLNLRDWALIIVSERGTWTPTVIGPVVMFEGEGVKIACRAPFQNLPEPQRVIRFRAAFQGVGLRHLPNRLNIWDTQDRKALDITWSDFGDVEMISYEPGRWEVDLEKLAGECAA